MYQLRVFIMVGLILSAALKSFAIEPQLYKGGPDKTPTYVKSLNLDRNEAIDKLFSTQKDELIPFSLLEANRYFNILVLGLDVPTRPKTTVQLDKYTNIPELTSRSDSINILSLDLLKGKHVLFSVYRGTIPVDSCWSGVTKPDNEADRIITNLFTFSKRSAFIQCIRDQMNEKLNKIEVDLSYKERLLPSGFKIHATIEIDVKRLKNAMSDMMMVAVSNLSLFNEIRSSSGITMDDLENLPGVVDAMRNRHDWDASGYQRAFNHAKFITYSLGFLGKILSITPDFFNELEDVYGYISSSLSFYEMKTLFKLTYEANGNSFSLTDSIRFKNVVKNGETPKYVSSIDICEFGPSNSTLIYKNGNIFRDKTTSLRGLLKEVETNWISIPNPEYKEDSPYLKHTKGRVLPE